MSSYGPDRHANARDRKRKKRREGEAMRGNRSVFEVQKAVVKRGRLAKDAGWEHETAGATYIRGNPFPARDVLS